jgi:hypothetical protein
VCGVHALPEGWIEAARQPPPPAERSGDFDFWIGEWECTWDGGRARNSVCKILGGRAVLESFDGSADADLRGISISVWDAAHGGWAQTWADNHGNVFQLTGGLRDGGAMEISTAPGLDGSVRRMTFANIAPDGFDWEWAASSDRGFEPMWSLRYTRTAG